MFFFCGAVLQCLWLFVRAEGATGKVVKCSGGGGHGFFLSPDGLCVECNQYHTISSNSLIQFSIV